MLNPVETSRYRKDIKREIKRGNDMRKMKEVTGLLMMEQSLPSKYRDHKLSGQYEGHRECHIEPDWLLVYYVSGPDLVFVRTGTHADVFDS
jgi:mRNA interferase YafQ